MDKTLMQGTLEMMILYVLSRGPSYGYEIAQTVLAGSDGHFELREGSLYPALHRMERRKLLASSWDRCGEGRRRKYYRITPAGRRVLKRKRDQWTSFTGAVRGVLEAPHGMA